MAHPYHWDVIGWMSDILSWRRDEVMAYYRTYYAPNNAVLIVAGDFDPAAALDAHPEILRPIPKAAPPPPPVTTVEPPQVGTQARRSCARRPRPRPSSRSGTRRASRTPDFFPLAVLERASSRGESSRLYRRLVREEQLAIAVSGGVQETIDPFLFTISVKPRPGADLARIEAVIEEELAKVKAEGLTGDEIRKALNMVRTEFFARLQTIAGKANVLGQAELQSRRLREGVHPDGRLRRRHERPVREAARKVFAENNKTVGRLVPEGGAK